MAKHPFPIKTKAAQTADIGIDLVAGVVRQELGWDFRKTPLESDFGIDGYIDIVTPDGYVTGKSLAVQVKTGATYFRERTANGLLFRGKIKHVNYYLNSPSKVLLILVDERDRHAWWRVFEVYETSRTGSGWTFEIPSSNLLSREAKPVLEILAGNHVDYLPHLEDFWGIERNIADHDLFVIQVQRLEIESFNVRPFARVFERLAASDDVRRAAMSKIDFLIDGYNDDERELAEIPEVIRWLKQATQTVKYFLYFLHLGPSPLGQGIGQIMAAHCLLRRVEGGLTVEVPENLFQLTNDLYGWLNEFTERFRLEAVNRPLSERFAGCLEGFLGTRRD